MTDRKSRMLEDQYLRDSARALVSADLNHLKSGLNRRGLGARAADRARNVGAEMLDEAVELASDNKGAVAAFGAAALVWFARNPILSALGFDRDGSADSQDRYDETPERFDR